MKVLNRHMNLVDYEAAVNLMDDDVRDEVNRKMAPCSEQEFFDAYCAEHERVFGMEFEPDKEHSAW